MADQKYQRKIKKKHNKIIFIRDSQTNTTSSKKTSSKLLAKKQRW